MTQPPLLAVMQGGEFAFTFAFTPSHLTSHSHSLRALQQPVRQRDSLGPPVRSDFGFKISTFEPRLLHFPISLFLLQYCNGAETTLRASVGTMYPRQLRSYRIPIRNIPHWPLSAG